MTHVPGKSCRLHGYGVNDCLIFGVVVVSFEALRRWIKRSMANQFRRRLRTDQGDRRRDRKNGLLLT